MLRAVLDTNIVVSGTISASGAPYEILEAWRNGRFTLCVSRPILDEIRRVFEYPRIMKLYKLEPNEVSAIIATIEKYAIVTPGDIAVDEIASDPSDNMLLACAIEAEADSIVSGDRHVLELRSYQGIHIFGARTFIAHVSIAE